MSGIFSRFRRFSRHVVFAFTALAGAAHAAPSIDTSAPVAFLMDFDSGTVLFEKNADQLTPPASMAKLMTLEVVFHEIKQGRLRLEDEFTVSENAWRRGGAMSDGSSMYLPLNSRVKLEDLIRGIAVQSGNDACIVIAEALGGSELGFAERMNRRAKELGFTKSRYMNSTGLPDPDQKVTMRELALLAAHLIRDYPEYYHYFAEPEFTFNKIRQHNRNPLLTAGLGADGLKTGYTKESGYGLVGSAVRDGQRLIVAMNGMKSLKERAEESRKLIEWGFRAFQQTTLFQAGEAVGEAKVFGGTQSRVPLVGKGAIKVLLPRGGGATDFRAKVVYKGPVEAPVRQGDKVAMLQVTNGGAVILETPLFAGETVERGSLVRRAWDAAAELVLSRF